MILTEDEWERLMRLIETPMKDLRIIAFDGGDEMPTQKEADDRFRGWTRAQLIRHVLDDSVPYEQEMRNE